MLTRTEFTALYRALRNESVLSVYVDGTETDPATQRSWRMQLDQQLADIRRAFTPADAATRRAFEACATRLGEATATLVAGVGAPGWAAFVTADRVQLAHHLPVAAPTTAAWNTGPRIAPYIRSLKEDRPVVVVVADARRANLYRYQQMALTRADVVRAHHVIEPPAHMGTPVRRGFHTGTRGATGRDAAQHALLEGRDRMIAQAGERALELAHPDGWVLVGGIKRVAARLARQLEAEAPNRTLQLPSLDVHASDVDITAAARSGASRLRTAADDRRIAEIVDASGANGLGATGDAATWMALAATTVRDLFVSAHYVNERPAAAERAIRAALDQDASIEVVTGHAAVRLDERGGIAAGLRFRVAGIDVLVSA